MAAGATVRLGGGPLAVAGLAGQFYQLTVVAGVTPDMAIALGEVFGPVQAVVTFRTFEEAVRLANASSFGLSAGASGKNVRPCLALARMARAGTVWSNSWMAAFAERPFWGVMESGQGRELGRYGLEEFLEVKTVQMRIGRTRAPWVTTR